MADMEMSLKPSEIRFSQSSIRCKFKNLIDPDLLPRLQNFRRKRRRYQYHKKIGTTLDEVMNGKCFIGNIPRISVMWDKEKALWITADNRRLWVFRHLERLGWCETIKVLQTTAIDERKMTSSNNGKSIIVESGYPGGSWYEAPDAVWLDPLSIKFCKKSIDEKLKDSSDHDPITVTQLKAKIMDGSVTSSQIPSIVVLKTDDTYKVCDGNKRLWAVAGANKEQLKDHKIRAVVFEDIDRLPTWDLCTQSKTNEYYDNCTLE